MAEFSMTIYDGAVLVFFKELNNIVNAVEHDWSDEVSSRCIKLRFNYDSVLLELLDFVYLLKILLYNCQGI